LFIGSEPIAAFSSFELARVPPLFANRATETTGPGAAYNARVEPTAFLITIAIAWVVVGLITSYVMGRRGHSPFGWWFLGAVFGPLVVLLAIDAARRARVTSQAVGLSGSRAEGPVDVLVGIDGSPQSAAALGAVCGLLGPRLGRLTLAAAVTYESAERTDTTGDRATAISNLERAAASVTCGTDTQLLTGPAAKTLVEYAREGSYDLLAIGSRGRGLSKALLGGVASHLVRQSRIPVLVVGQTD
jgi:nucleotide-binding universal stress UspA family protein